MRPHQVLATAFALVLPLVVTIEGKAIESKDGDEQREQTEIHRTHRIGAGLLWGGAGTTTAGGLILLGLIPTSRSLRLADAQLEMCRVSMELDPVTFDCIAAEDDVSRRLRARNAVAITGSLVIAGGLAVLGTGLWMRRKARRNQREHDKKYKPEWSVLPDVGLNRGGLHLRIRF